jgi:hypothetical protein
MTRVDANSEIGLPQVERFVGRPVSTVFPNNYQAARSALNNAPPLALDNLTRLAAAFTDFARQLSGIRAGRTERNKPSGQLSVLGGRGEDPGNRPQEK